MNSGWMVNFQMRRVEPVETKQDPSGYAIWKGPRRTYKLHVSQVYQTEREALVELERRMNARYLKLQAQLVKYRSELCSVRESLQPIPLRNGDYTPEELTGMIAQPVDDCGNWSEQDFTQLDRVAFEASLPVPAYVYWDDKHSRYLTNCNHSACAVYQGNFEGWQARAALERKR